MSDPREMYESQTPVQLTIQGNAGGFDVALTASIDGSDTAAIDLTLDRMRRAFMRQEAHMRLTLHLEDLRKAEFTLKHLPETLATLKEARGVERAEMVASWNAKWVADGRLGPYKMHSSERGNLDAFDRETERKLAEIAGQEKALPLRIKQLEDMAADYRGIIAGKDKYEAIERRFVEDNLRPHELPEAAD